MKQRKVQQRSSTRSRLAIVAFLLLCHPTVKAGDTPTFDSTANLVRACRSPLWYEYMSCQAFIYDAGSANASVCVPSGVNAARLQLGFLRFLEQQPELNQGVPAVAVQLYLERNHYC
ncbi:MAG: hypothetical protein AAF384_09815 [Pseudomonadota bacterium]